MSSQFDEVPCCSTWPLKIRSATTLVPGVLPQCGPKRQAAGRGAGAQRVWRELRNWAALLGSLFDGLPRLLGLPCNTDLDYVRSPVLERAYVNRYFGCRDEHLILVCHSGSHRKSPSSPFPRVYSLTRYCAWKLTLSIMAG